MTLSKNPDTFESVIRPSDFSKVSLKNQPFLERKCQSLKVSKSQGYVRACVCARESVIRLVGLALGQYNSDRRAQVNFHTT